MSLTDTLARVLAEHPRPWIEAAREGRYAICDSDVCGWEGETHDGTEDCYDDHRAHVAAALVAAIRTDEGLRQEAAQGIHDAECEAYRHEGRNGKCERQARAALDAICGGGTC